MKKFDWDDIKIIITDCDGVLTDNSIIYDNTNTEIKTFSARDGLGVFLWQKSGGLTAVITGRESHALQRRANDLHIEHLYQKVSNKYKVAEKLLNELGLDFSNAAYIGDDYNDLPLLKAVKFSAAPIDCAEGISKRVNYVTTKAGGKGALRELIDYILHKQGKHEETIQDFVEHLINR